MDALNALLALTPREFEHVAATYLKSRGFTNVHVTGGAGDLGVDIRCQDEFGRLVVAQCKRYQPGAKVGSPEIQHFFGMAARHRAARGIFVTTSSFTEPARQLARDCDIELVSGGEIADFYRAVDAELRAEDERQREEALQRAAEERQRQAEEADRLRQEVAEEQRRVAEWRARRAEEARKTGEIMLAGITAFIVVVALVVGLIWGWVPAVIAAIVMVVWVLAATVLPSK